MLIIFFGDIGVGKSTTARALAERTGFRLVQFDSLVSLVTGKEKMYGKDNEFLLSEDEERKVHDAMLGVAEGFLCAGESVILESMFFKEQRDQAVAFAERLGISYRLIHVVCDEAENDRRVEDRLAKSGGQSAGIGLLREFRGQLGDEPRPYSILDTTGKTVDECVNEAIRLLGLY